MGSLGRQLFFSFYNTVKPRQFSLENWPWLSHYKECKKVGTNFFSVFC